MLTTARRTTKAPISAPGCSNGWYPPCRTALVTNAGHQHQHAATRDLLPRSTCSGSASVAGQADDHLSRGRIR